MNIIGNNWEQVQSEDRLNLVFENRNKAYGAYLLRKNYIRNKIIGMLGAPILLALVCLLAFMPKTKALGLKQYAKLTPPTADTLWIEDASEPLSSDIEKDNTRSSSAESDVPLVNPIASTALFKGISGLGVPNGEGNNPFLGGRGEDHDKPYTPSKQDTITYVKPDKSCEFLAYGGAFNKFVEDSFDPSQSCDDGFTGGYAEVRFMVDRFGHVSKVTLVETNARCEAFTREIERVFSASPRWSPAMKQGKFVNAWHSIRVELEF